MRKSTSTDLMSAINEMSEDHQALVAKVTAMSIILRTLLEAAAEREMGAAFSRIADIRVRSLHIAATDIPEAPYRSLQTTLALHRLWDAALRHGPAAHLDVT